MSLICDKCRLPTIKEFDGVIRPVYVYRTEDLQEHHFHPQCAKEFSGDRHLKLYNLELCFDNGESVK